MIFKDLGQSLYLLTMCIMPSTIPTRFLQESLSAGAIHNSKLKGDRRHEGKSRQKPFYPLDFWLN